MVGITSYGAYIPWYRLDRQNFVKAWGGFAVPGERAVAYWDEDSVTMAVEAAFDCLEDMDLKKVDGLFFASTSAPYKEKQCSSIMAIPLDLRRDIRTADFNTSLRSGTIAIAQACDTIKAGSADSVLVTAADNRIGGISGFNEQTIGDGAAAFLLGNEDVIAEIQTVFSISDELSGTWRAPQDTFVNAWEDRMIQDESYTPVLTEAITGLMKKAGLEPKDFTKVVVDCPGDPRGHAKLLASFGFETTQIQDPVNLFMNVGFCGCAHAPMLLVSALEDAKPGDRILFAGQGNGSDVFSMQVTDAIEKLKPRKAIKKHLESKTMMGKYNDYLRWRELVPLEAARRPKKEPNRISAIWRQKKELLGLYGIKCRKCGTPQYDNGANSSTPIRICAVCHTQDDFEDYRFADKRGTVFSFTNDVLAPSIDPPCSVVLVDFEGGGRSFLDMTDRDPEAVKIGLEVEMTFRKIHFDQGYTNYFWKARPIRIDQ